jgi:predicted MFS family arabinose efflux permease
VWAVLTAGIALMGAFVVFEARTPDPMLPLTLFESRTFSVANAQTFAIYGGIGLLGFFVTIYLQQVAGYSALKSGVTGLVPTVVMFALSARMGRLADRFGARWFLTVGPLLVATGFALMQRYGTSVSLLTDVLPALLVFALGLAVTVSPLTATVLADARDIEAGIASAVNNAIARTAGLISVAAVGAIVAAHYGALVTARLGDRLPASSHTAVVAAERRTFGTIDERALPPTDRVFARRVTAHASEDAFHLAMGIGSGLLVLAAIGGAVGLRPQRGSAPAAGDCPGGQFVGSPPLDSEADQATRSPYSS